MKSNFQPLLFFLLVLALMLAACTPAGAPGTELPGSGAGPTDPPEVSETPDPSPMPTEDPSGPYTLEWLESLSPESVLLQLDYEPTFFRREAFHPFGRFPVFTLYADGTLVYLNAGETFEEQTIELVRLSPEETLQTLENVMAMGFENLEDHLDFCHKQEDGSEVCIADDAYTILRAVLSSGEFREVKIYSDFANDPKVFSEVKGFMSTFSHPEAAPYLPAHATLFVNRLNIQIEAPIREWPLDPEVMSGLSFDKFDMAVIVLEGPALERYLEQFDPVVSSYFFEVEGKTYETYFVPWLPKGDYGAQIEEAFPLSKSG